MELQGAYDFPEQLLELPEETYRELLGTGTLRGSGQEGVRPDCLLVIHHENYDFCGNTPGRDIKKFLREARLGAYDTQRDQLLLLSREPLGRILSSVAHSLPPEETLRGRFLNDAQARNKAREYNAVRYQFIMGSKEYGGRFWCCGCGFPACGSTCAWISNWACMAIFIVGGASLDRVILQPPLPIAAEALFHKPLIPYEHASQKKFALFP